MDLIGQFGVSSLARLRATCWSQRQPSVRPPGLSVLAGPDRKIIVDQLKLRCRGRCRILWNLVHPHPTRLCYYAHLEGLARPLLCDRLPASARVFAKEQRAGSIDRHRAMPGRRRGDGWQTTRQTRDLGFGGNVDPSGSFWRCKSDIAGVCMHRGRTRNN